MEGGTGKGSTLEQGDEKNSNQQPKMRAPKRVTGPICPQLLLLATLVCQSPRGLGITALSCCSLKGHSVISMEQDSATAVCPQLAGSSTKSKC